MPDPRVSLAASRRLEMISTMKGSTGSVLFKAKSAYGTKQTCRSGAIKSAWERLADVP